MSTHAIRPGTTRQELDELMDRLGKVADAIFDKEIQADLVSTMSDLDAALGLDTKETD